MSGSLASGAGNRDPLLLPSRHFDRTVEPSFGKPHDSQKLHAPVARLVGTLAGECHGRCDVLQCRHILDQIELLEDVTNLAGAKKCQFLRRQLSDVDFVDKDAAAGRTVKPRRSC